MTLSAPLTRSRTGWMLNVWTDPLVTQKDSSAVLSVSASIMMRCPWGAVSASWRLSQPVWSDPWNRCIPSEHAEGQEPLS